MIKEEPDDDIVIEETFDLVAEAMEKTSYKYCNVYGCIAHLDNPEGTLFELPDDQWRRSLWLKRLGREDLNEMKLRFFVCEEHFKSTDFTFESNCKKLKKDAIPSLFLPNVSFEDKGIQAQPIMCDTCVQTTEPIEKKDASVQVACETFPDLKKRLNLEHLRNKKRLMVFEQGPQSIKKQKFRQGCDRFLSDQLAELVKCQSDLQVNKRGNRYALPHKIFSINLFLLSPKVHKMLEKDFSLASSTILRKMYVPISPGFCIKMVRALKLKVCNMSEAEKCCAVVVDTMKLKANLYYDAQNDTIVGFHDIGGTKIVTPAMYAVVVLVRGINDDWMQPVAFSFVSETEKPWREISKWIDKILMKLLQVGLKIKAYIPSSKSNLLDEANVRQISVNKPHFYINDTKIYYIFSVPEMMKQLRNSFLAYNFVLEKDSSVGMLDFVKEFYEQDKTKTLRMAPKLTEDHFQPHGLERNSLRYATQMFSNTVATALETYIEFNVIDPKARDTVLILLLMNKLFDVLNSTKFTDEPYKTAYNGSDIQKEILEIGMDFFLSLKLIHAKTGIAASYVAEFIEGFQVTISAIVNLFEDMKLEGCNSLFTGRLNLNIINDFFKAIRAKSDMTVVPISQHFIMCFRRLYYSNILKPLKGGGSSSKELTQLLIQLSEPTGQCQERNEPSPSNSCGEYIWHEITTTKFNELKQSDKISIKEIGIFLLKICISKHKNCEVLQNFFSLFQSGDINAELSLKNFVEYIFLMEEEFRKAFETIKQNSNFAVPVYEKIMSLEFLPPCPCFPVKHFQKIFIRLRIFMTVQYNNSIYRKNRHRGSSFGIPEITKI